jgi:MerR family transcriptional regulator, light-induced transcriptional regulator
MTSADVDERLTRDNASGVPWLTVQEVARRLGVPRATLRSWNQRYGVGPVRHDPGRHRLYSEADVAVVQHMHELIGQGASTRAAAKAALQKAVPPLDSAGVVLKAALELDAITADETLERHLRHFGTADTWEKVIRPVFAVIDDRQSNGDGCIDVEHVLSWTVARCLQRISAPAPETPASIILACTESESHTLVLEVLRAALSEANRSAVMLGAATPLSAVLDAVNRRPLPTTVVLFSQTRHASSVKTAQAITQTGARLLVAGPGWETEAVSAEVTWISSLDEALRYLLSAP